MENKNNIILFSVVFLIVGVFVGWLICSNKSSSTVVSNMHQMADGTVMPNQKMDMKSMMTDMSMSLKDKEGNDRSNLHHSPFFT